MVIEDPTDTSPLREVSRHVRSHGDGVTCFVSVNLDGVR